MSAEDSNSSVDGKGAATAVSVPVTKPTVNIVTPETLSKRSIWQWFHPDDGPLERKLITKLDLSILTFACLGFWVLYIDRGMFANAYVSGMREDLKMKGNQFVQANSLFTSGYAMSIIPLTILNTRLPPQWVIPISMVIWGLFTILISIAQTHSQVFGFRFLVGFGEGAFFPSIHYVFGSWYRPDEITRRAGVFYIAAAIGTASTGFVAGGVYRGLNGVLGRAGWRWMFIIGGVVTFPVAVFGLLTFPGTPDSSRKSWILSDEELEIAKERMRVIGRKPKQPFPVNAASLKRIFGRWHFWVLIPTTIVIQQGFLSMGQGTWTLWIRSNKQYSIPTVNDLTTIMPLVGLIWVVSFSLITDRYGHISKLPIFAFANTLMFISHLAFVLYDHSPFGYKWFAVAVGMVENATMPVWFSWANLICKDDAEERAFILGAMLSISMAFQSWTPLVVLPTVEAPRFFKGYTYMLVTQPIAFAMISLLYYLDKEGRKPSESKKEEVEENGGVEEIKTLA